MDISLRSGFIGAFGPDIDGMALSALQALEMRVSDPNRTQKLFHITLITKHELRRLGTFDLAAFKAKLSGTSSRVFSLGIGGKRSLSAPVLFVVILWNAVNNARKILGLPPKQLHITLTNLDDHERDKGYDSIIPGTFPVDPSLDLLDHLTCSLLHRPRDGRTYAIQACTQFPDSIKGWLRLGDILTRLGEWKLAMLAFGRALHPVVSEDKVTAYCLEKMASCSEHTEWGHAFLDGELESLPAELAVPLIKPWEPQIRSLIADSLLSTWRPSLCTETRTHFLIPAESGTTQLPRFFRWIVPFHFALMSTPRDANDIRTLALPALGIRHVITLTEETPLPPSWFTDTGVKHTHLPVKNYSPPSIEQMDFIMRMFEDPSNLPILVHCGGGKGRAGTVAACYIAAYGFTRLKCDEPVMSAKEAIEALRTIRPGSLETQRQEDFVQHWISAVWKRRSVVPNLIEEPTPTGPIITGRVNASTDLIILVGLPGSGKSTFSATLMARDERWRRVSQDDSGSRTACETDIGRRGTGKVILDRCNPVAEDRTYWVSLASNWAENPVAIFFDFPPDLCASRAQQRPDHPTLPPGNRVRMAIGDVKKRLEAPTLKEGYVGIAVVRSLAAVAEVLQRIAPSALYKFPRTSHLIDLGGLTDDDIYTPLSRATDSPNTVVITEKIDGANLGFSLSPDRSLLVQNRSHYVNSSSHEQFRKLEGWIAEHREALYTILDRDPIFPERYVLFGEWLALTHSIPYTSLPSLFIAFDLYDKQTRTFASSSSLRALLPPSIHTVPILWSGPESQLPDEPALKAMVHTKSAFYEGPLEGIYLKFESPEKVLRRGKIVRGDFIAGNDHWTKGGVRKNGIAIVD